MKNDKSKTPEFPAIPKSAPTPPPPTGPQPSPDVIRFRKGDGTFKPAPKGQPAVCEEIDDAPGV
jgi:hypothetical protein